MERNKYKEAILTCMRRSGPAPLTGEELLQAAAGACPDTAEFWEELLELEKNGAIIKKRFNTYGLPEQMGLVTGRFQLTASGFGFVIPDNRDGQPDIFIPPNALNGAMNNDRVMARVNNAAHGRKPEGEIVRVLVRANTKIVGTFHKSGDFAFVVPDDRKLGQDIYIARRNFNGARARQKVVAEITAWPQGNRSAEGRVLEILGTIGDVGLDILSIIKQNDLPLEFPPEVLRAAEKLPASVAADELRGRRDLRGRAVVTIDGEDAKDLDDAVYARRLGEDEFLLGVYIADVSYYVTEGSLLDREAAERATSVYLVDRVLPMLPVRLSNGICSLNAGEDRLAMACEMHVSGAGKITAYELFPAVIHVRHRLSYNIVREILAGDAGQREKYADVVPMLEEMDALRGILHAKRRRRGAIDFDLPEQKVILDDELKPLEIVQRVHGNAESLIEEFMLAANETVARHMAGQKWPFVYRVHDVPSEDKMRDLGRLLAAFNVKFAPSAEIRPLAVQKAVAAMAGRPEERLVNMVALRCMKQAVYQTENIGHFGLAAEYYTHFTSPIRRYPDLIVHRLLRQWLENPVMKEQRAEELQGRLAVIAEHSSVKERAAAEAERATVELKMAEYMAGRIGEEFDGVISGVTAFGMFVELENGVEGLVRIAALTDDYYEFFEERYALVGMRTQRQYRLGDKVRIEVLQVNMADASIDFIMAGESDAMRGRLSRQLSGRQKSPAARAVRTAAPGNAGPRSTARKGAKNKLPGRRSARHGQPGGRKKHRKNR